jgi:hypothetical protein
MPDEYHETGDPRQREFEAAKEQGHETLATRSGLIVLFGVGLLALMGFALLTMYGMAHRFTALERRPDPDLPLLERQRTPPPPHVIPNQAFERQRQEALHTQWLDSYGWIDERERVARIPIGRAIDILAERGLQTVQRDDEAPAPPGRPNAADAAPDPAPPQPDDQRN